MSGANPFADDEARFASPAEAAAPASSPYRAPTVDSRLSEAVTAGGPRVRIPAPYALVICQTPFVATYVVCLVVQAFGAYRWTPVFLLTMATLDAILFNARTLAIGPGRFVTRATVAIGFLSLCAFSIAWHALVTGKDSLVGFGTITESNAAVGTTQWLASIAAPTAYILAILGSRDLPVVANDKTSWRADWIAMAIAAVVGAAAAIPAAIGVVDWSRVEEERNKFSEMAPGIAAPIILMGVLLALMQYWRVSIRGFNRLLSWQTFAFAGLILLPIGYVVFRVATGTAPESSAPPSGRASVLIAVVGFPIARELFLRFAGYRARNAWLETWKAYRERRRAARMAASDDAGRVESSG